MLSLNSSSPGEYARNKLEFSHTHAVFPRHIFYLDRPPRCIKSLILILRSFLVDFSIRFDSNDNTALWIIFNHLQLWDSCARKFFSQSTPGDLPFGSTGFALEGRCKNGPLRCWLNSDSVVIVSTKRFSFQRTVESLHIDKEVSARSSRCNTVRNSHHPGTCCGLSLSIQKHFWDSENVFFESAILFW